MTHPISPLALFAGILVLTAMSLLFLWTASINKFFFFARTVPAAFRDTVAARGITRRYIAMLVLSFGIADLVLIGLYAFAGRSITVAIIAGIVVEGVLAHVAFGIAHAAAGKALVGAESSIEREGATDTPEHVIAVPLLSARAASPAQELQGLLAPVLLAVSLWFGIFAVSDGNLASFADAASAGGGAVLLGMACGMLFAATGLRLLLRYSSRHRTAMASYILRVMSLVSWAAAAIVGGVAFAASRHWAITKDQANIAMTVIFGLAMIHIIYIWTQSQRFAPAAAEQNGDHYWRWGIFYYNTTDPALFVQRRMGPGYTLNFGNVFSWPISAFFVGDVVFVLIKRHYL